MLSILFSLIHSDPLLPWVTWPSEWLAYVYSIASIWVYYGGSVLGWSILSSSAFQGSMPCTLEAQQ